MDKSIVAAMEGVEKRVGGRLVLRGVSLEVRAGEVHVLAGPNGAGKTTSIRVLLGLLKPDAGRVSLLGSPPGSLAGEASRLIGYLPEDAEVYERLTGWENLLFYARLYAGSRREVVEIARRGAEISGLPWEVLRRRAGEYSKGMKRRLLLARALMHQPRLAVLDEPTSGLDVFSAVRVREAVKSMASRGTAFLVTTHNLLEASLVADRVTFIAGGRTVFTGTPGEALERYGASNLEEAFVRAVGQVDV
ncbi:ABC transporter ATP-binding protein [Stetteria hydrogenophila]